MRTFDLIAPLPQYQASLGNLFSLETWGGATFDVAYRFLKEDPWARLRKMRAAAPDMLFRCCFGVQCGWLHELSRQRRQILCPASH